MRGIWFLALLVGAGAVDAHIGERDLVEIDLHDGSADDWERVLGAPSIVLDDFTHWAFTEPPTGLDLRVWLGWHADPARLYVAMERVDDIYTNNYHFTFNSPKHLDTFRPSAKAPRATAPSPRSSTTRPRQTASCAPSPMVSKASTGTASPRTGTSAAAASASLRRSPSRSST